MTDATFATRPAYDPGFARPGTVALEASASAVSWAAVIAGALIAAAVSFALFALGAGIGLGSVSPWSTNNPSPTTFGILVAIWLLAVQLFAYGVGGYMAGRLRTRWVSTPTDEVFFRDTAHGFLVWALGAVLTVLLLSAAAMAAAGASHAGNGAASATSGGGSDKTTYLMDTLFRTEHPVAPADLPALRDSENEVQRIMTADATSGDMPATDRTYIAQLVAARTGISQQDADKRVSTVVDQAKTAADKARKVGAYVSLWTFIALLVGAFSASYMATVGGRERDDLPVAG
ncbi:MAG TPA: hypothetical protein VGH40_08860 [Roseiarcus sp.]|jgi:hypothetical protein